MSESRERLKRNTRKQRLPRLIHRFDRNIEALSKILESEGFRFESQASDYARDFYQRLPMGVQRRLLLDLGFYIKLLADFKSSGVSLWDTPRLTWAFLKASGLQPSSQIFAKISGDEVIEVYNSEYIQIFRNMAFFEVYAGSLFDLCVLDWMSLFRRDPQIEEQIFIQLGSSFRQIAPLKEMHQVPEHILALRFAEGAMAMECQPQFCSSLIKRQTPSRKVGGVLFASSLKSVYTAKSKKRKAG